MQAITNTEIVKNIKDTESISYITESGECNFSTKYVTAEMVLTLQGEGTLAYNIFDQIFVWSKWIDPLTGDYNENFKKVFEQRLTFIKNSYIKKLTININ